MAKMHLVPIRRGYWGKNSGLPHTIPMKLSGTCGSVSVRLIPAPRGTGLVAAPASKKILACVCGVKILIIECPKAPDRAAAPRTSNNSGPGSCLAVAKAQAVLADYPREAARMPNFSTPRSMAGLEDCYSTTRGHSRTTGNFITAVFNAVSASYGYLSPELWKPTVFSKAPFQEHTDFLAKEAESAKADAAY